MRTVLPGLLLPVAVLTLSQAAGTSTRAVVAAAAAYVADYQQKLTYVLADETYTQHIVSQRPEDPSMPRERRLESETFFLFTAPEDGWMAIRDVTGVDGQPVADRRSPLEILRQPSRQVAAEFKAANARFNIGRTYRNFNEPTLALLVLDDLHRRRFAFERARVARDGDAGLVTIAFRERDTPTLIRDVTRGRVFSRGEIVVEAGTGRVRRTMLSARVGELSVQLDTEFGYDQGLGMWVPVRFRERYERGDARSGRGEHERIECEAIYTNYRRFDATVRIR